MTPRRVLIAVPVLAVAAVIAAVAIWWFFIRETHELATSAPAIPTELRSATGTPASGALTFRIVPERSDASYFADEKLASLPLPDTAKGSTNAITGEFYLMQDGRLDPSQESKFIVDLRTLKSDQDRRDRRVQENALETSKFPTATFTPTKVTGWIPPCPQATSRLSSLQASSTCTGCKRR